MNNSEESPLLPSDSEQESLEKIIDTVTPNRAIRSFMLLLLLVPLIVSESNDISNRTQVLITGCSLTNQNFTLENCFNLTLTNGTISPVSKCLDDSLNYEFPSGYQSIILYVVLGLILITVEFNILYLISFEQKILYLLSFRLYVGVQRKKYFISLVLIATVTILYAVLKYDFFSSLEKEENFFICDSTIIYFESNNQYFGIFIYLKTIFLMGLSLKDPILDIFHRITNLYQYVDFKTLAKNGTPFAFLQFAKLRKIELRDLESQLAEYVEANYPNLSKNDKKKYKDVAHCPVHVLKQVVFEMEQKKLIGPMTPSQV